MLKVYIFLHNNSLKMIKMSELWQIMSKKEYNFNTSAFVGINVWMYLVFSTCIIPVILYDLYDC